MFRILVIDDDAATQTTASRVLGALGHEVVAVDASEALWRLDAEPFDVVVAGIEPSTEDLPPEPPEQKVFIHLARPFAMEDVVNAVAGLEQQNLLERELGQARMALERQRHTSPIIGGSPAMLRVLDQVAAVAESPLPVLLSGESGTGKDLLARTIHQHSIRKDRPLITINCAAFPETLLEAELFGHEKGAFTGAVQKREGRFQAADGGTLFLDEINGLPLASQAKLLRVLQDGTFQPLGTNVTLAVDVRIISATNRNLATLVAEGKFREDLYYRIKVVDLEVPPLRERKNDLPLLLLHFLAKYGPPSQPAPSMTPAAWAAFNRHRFPGNVRELEHAVQHALVMSRGQEIDLDHLPRDLRANERERDTITDVELRPLAVVLQEFERDYLSRALHIAGGNKTRAARLLGISRKHLWQKLNRAPSTFAAPGNDGGYEH